MTGESPNRARRAACPAPSLIAAHADRRLSGEEAARMDEHVAGCPDCYAVFSETVQLGLAEEEREGVRRRGARTAAPLALAGRPGVKTLLAVAAVLVVTVGLWLYRARVERVPTPAVAGLVEAMGARRFVEPRLTGGFRHGRLVILRSGEGSRGLDAQPAAVIAAVARIRERAEGDPSPEALGALGVTYLVSRDAAAAVKALESASAQDPDDARLLSDLSAAYLVRAKEADEPADIPKALEAAERAIALPDPPVEAYFNRALALESLHLVEAARRAWEDYLERDPASGWADEARQHLEALPRPRRSSAEEDKARVRQALEEGASAVDRLAEGSPSLLREYLEDELLPAWADAYLAGHPEAGENRERARLLAEALLRATGDALPRDTVEALSEPGAARSGDPLRAQAQGFRALREANRLQAGLEPSCHAFRGARRGLQAGGSPYAGWAEQMAVSTCLLASDPTRAMAELGRLSALASTRGYRRLLGRVRWLQGLVHLRRGELTASLDLYRAARADFVTTGDTEGEAFMLASTAENIHLLGQTSTSWKDRLDGLALLDQVRNPRRRHAILSEAVVACLGGRLARSALHFGNALVQVARDWARPMAVSDALVLRAGIQHSLGAGARAAADIRESRRWSAQIAEESLAQRQAAEVDAAEGEILMHAEPEASARLLRASLRHFQAAAPMRVPVLHLHLARALAARGLDDAAEEQLLAGIQALEGQRVSLRDASLQVSFFDQALSLFDDLVRLQVVRRRHPHRALALVERSRARQLVDAMAGAAGHPLAPDALRRELPAGVTLVYHVALEDRLLAWALSREDSHFIERPLAAAELSRLVAAHRAAVEGRAAPEAVRRAAARLHDELVRPLIPFITPPRALIFVPDGILQTVAFAGLWDRRTHRYLVEDYTVGLAPSGTVFARASQHAAEEPEDSAPKVLVVGNPHLDRHLGAGLPDLPGAEAEAGDIARLYARSELLTGTGATKAAFLEGLRRSRVVHFAGHGAASLHASSSARLLLSADPSTGEAGTLYLHELAGQRFPRTRVVVLAACRSAGGAVSRVEGAMSLCRPFLAAGVPSVVASLWDIDDATSRSFFVSFHRALQRVGDPLLALRRAQLDLLRSQEASLSHPVSWAAFICMGGLDPHSLSKGEVS